MYTKVCSIPRTDDLYDLFPLDDLDLSGQIDQSLIYTRYDLHVAYVVGWEPYNLHDLPLGMFPGLDSGCTDPAQHHGRLGSRVSRS